MRGIFASCARSTLSGHGAHAGPSMPPNRARDHRTRPSTPPARVHDHCRQVLVAGTSTTCDREKGGMAVSR
jgi:hypothetical protein